MRPQIPEDIDVWLHQAKVDSDRVDELDVAYLAAADELADALNSRGVAVRVVAHEHQARVAGKGGQLLSLRDGRGQRVFPPGVLSRLPCAPGGSEAGRGGGWRCRPRRGRAHRGA